MRLKRKTKLCDCKKIHQYFKDTMSNQDPEFDDSGFILRDGSFALLSGRDELQDIHVDPVIDAMGGKNTGCYLDEYLQECDAIRFRYRGNSHKLVLSSYIRPNQKQIKSIQTAFKPWVHTNIRFCRQKEEERDCCLIKETEELTISSVPKRIDVQRWISKCW